MPYKQTGRPTGRPRLGTYIAVGTTLPHQDVSEVGEGAIADLTVGMSAEVRAKVRALASDSEARRIALAAIASGIGFDSPGASGAMNARIRAMELLSRLCGDLVLAPPALINATGEPGEPNRVVFVRPDSTLVSLEAEQPSEPEEPPAAASG